MTLQYAIAFVADMNAAVRFYRDTLGLPLRFQSPGRTEFETGATTLAWHPSSEANRPGTVQLGFNVPNMTALAAQLAREGLRFTREPALEHGALLAEFVDSAGTRYSVSAPPSYTSTPSHRGVEPNCSAGSAPGLRTGDAQPPVASGGFPSRLCRRYLADAKGKIRVYATQSGSLKATIGSPECC